MMLLLCLQCCSLLLFEENEKEWFVMDPICTVSLCLPLILSSASVVFDFNVSLNDFAPMNPMSLPVVLMRMEKSVLLTDFICVLFI